MVQWLLAWCGGAVAVSVLACWSVSGAETPPVFAQFQGWVEKYLKTSAPEPRTVLEKEGEALATQRREALMKLIQSAPQRALELAVTQSWRRELPPSITQYFEQCF